MSELKFCFVGVFSDNVSAGSWVGSGAEWDVLFYFNLQPVEIGQWVIVAILESSQSDMPAVIQAGWLPEL
jgi:hypothetical protein